MIKFNFDGAVLAKTIRAVRRFAGLKQGEMAERMQKRPRSYQHLEGGKHNNLDVTALFEVAAATGADPFAMVIATLLGRPEIALRMADNKLAAAFLIELAEFNEVVGDEAASLRTYEIVAAFRGAFKDLAGRVDRPYPGS